MSVYVVTGKLGAGKTLVAVGRIRDYLIEGRKVATNLNLNLHNLIGIKAKKTRVTRLPDVPTLDHLESIGLGYEGQYQGEERNGLLVLDECGSFLNARDFNDKNRRGLQNWVIHARKKRWDVIFIIQHLEALDKQFRLMFAEHTVFCMRFDRVPIPVLSFVIKAITGFRLTFPKMHRGLVKYGSGQNAINVDTWWYRGTTLYDAYDTEQAFSPDDNQNNYMYLPPYYTHGVTTNGYKEFKRTARRYIQRISFKAKQLFFIGLLGGFFLPSLAFPPQEEMPAQDPPGQSEIVQGDPEPDPIFYVVGQLKIDDQTILLFQDDQGRSVYPQSQGYRIRPIHDCKVALIKKGRAIYAQCPDPSGFDFMSEQVGSGTTQNLAPFGNERNKPEESGTESSRSGEANSP